MNKKTDITLTFPVTENEWTNAPWWAVIDPEILERPDFDDEISARDIACTITGPFFSRADAQRYLDGQKHNYSEKAIVYCLSGHASKPYSDAWNNE